MEACGLPYLFLLYNVILTCISQVICAGLLCLTEWDTDSQQQSRQFKRNSVHFYCSLLTRSLAGTKVVADPDCRDSHKRRKRSKGCDLRSGQRHREESGRCADAKPSRHCFSDSSNGRLRELRISRHSNSCSGPPDVYGWARCCREI